MNRGFGRRTIQRDPDCCIRTVWVRSSASADRSAPTPGRNRFPSRPDHQLVVGEGTVSNRRTWGHASRSRLTIGSSHHPVPPCAAARTTGAPHRRRTVAGSSSVCNSRGRIVCRAADSVASTSRIKGSGCASTNTSSSRSIPAGSATIFLYAPSGPSNGVRSSRFRVLLPASGLPRSDPGSPVRSSRSTAAPGAGGPCGTAFS